MGKSLSKMKATVLEEWAQKNKLADQGSPELFWGSAITISILYFEVAKIPVSRVQVAILGLFCSKKYQDTK